MQAHAPVRPRTLFLDTHDVARLIGILGLPACLRGLAGTLRADYLRWPEFDKEARIAAYSEQGTIELMPITDGTHYSFKCVNGRWDLLAELRAADLQELSRVLERIRLIRGISQSETSIHLQTYRAA